MAGGIYLQRCSAPLPLPRGPSPLPPCARHTPTTTATTPWQRLVSAHLTSFLFTLTHKRCRASQIQYLTSLRTSCARRILVSCGSLAIFYYFSLWILYCFFIPWSVDLIPLMVFMAARWQGSVHVIVGRRWPTNQSQSHNSMFIRASWRRPYLQMAANRKEAKRSRRFVIHWTAARRRLKGLRPPRMLRVYPSVHCGRPFWDGGPDESVRACLGPIR